MVALLYDNYDNAENPAQQIQKRIDMVMELPQFVADQIEILTGTER